MPLRRKKRTAKPCLFKKTDLRKGDLSPEEIRALDKRGRDRDASLRAGPPPEEILLSPPEEE
jgi:predicted metal-binding transcription factor (methanogenesis marker protein 9)